VDLTHRVENTIHARELLFRGAYKGLSIAIQPSHSAQYPALRGSRERNTRTCKRLHLASQIHSAGVESEDGAGIGPAGHGTPIKPVANAPHVTTIAALCVRDIVLVFVFVFVWGWGCL